MSILDGAYWEKEMKPLTNADLLRGMTDEELEAFLKKVGGCGPTFDEMTWCIDRPCRATCWIEWLQTEVKV